MQPSTPQALRGDVATEQPSVTFFVCANSARGAEKQDHHHRRRPNVPEPSWPFTLHQVVVPCVGRLQPEHLLKAFEAGSDATVVVACAEDNCHYHEGSRRCGRRVEYIRGILDAIGLGSERLILTHLPGSALQDLAVGEDRQFPVVASEDRDLLGRLAELRSLVTQRIAALPADPIHRTMFPETIDSELDDQDESDE
jgi:coenzyme F420-reducing hydrogenase delta subunit